MASTAEVVTKTTRRRSQDAWKASNPIAHWASRIVATLRKRALERSLPCAVTHEYLRDIAPSVCPILGIPIRYESGRGRGGVDASPSVDRFDPGVGYVPGNVSVMSHRANTIKSHGTATEHRRIADWMDAHNGFAH